ncbi:MAG: GFA family protein [Acetobacteraceae bacterium]|nr:GFA family protein [Acetobacteraceae bacterium]
MRIDGACHGGSVAFEAEADTDTARICHCADCQKMSGSLFRANIQASSEGFRLPRGKPKIYARIADSGARLAQAFCPDCGAGVYATQARNPARYSLPVGTMTQRAIFRPTHQMWCQSALPWTAEVAGLEKRERG